MTDIDSKDQCIAITSDGTRCSRIAKDGEYCFQHDSSSNTIDSEQSDSQSIENIDPTQIKNTQNNVSGIQEDIKRNYRDLVASTQGVSDGLLSGGLSEALDVFTEAVRSTAGTTAKYALVGGTAGAIGGPAGVAAGVTGGAWYGVYKVAGDDRAVQAQIVNEIPEGANEVKSSNRHIEDVEPIQLAIQSAIETGETENEWLSSTIFREQNMDEVKEALDGISKYQNESGMDEYYIRNEDGGELLLLVFGEPVDD